MKCLGTISIFLGVALSAAATIHVTVCDPVHLRPLPRHEVMLGSHVSLLVHSDANDLWSGGLFIQDAYRAAGVLSWRDDHNDSNAAPDQASCLPAAGDNAFILRWRDSWMSGYDLYADELNRTAGDWFVLDYTPLAEGPCLIHVFNHSRSFTVPDPNQTLALVNSASRDLNGDGVVNYADFAIFSSCWMAQDCTDPNACGRADLNRDGTVGLTDVLMFADFWLWGTPNWPPEGATVPVEPEPTIMYSIVDPNGLSEVSIPVGDSIRLYLDITTFQEDEFIFYLEVLISDPNLGWIDNTPYDPNNPAGSGTAELLASPRTTFFDYWGPGYVQYEGIQFLAASLNGPIEDGVIASFVYTATEAGTVTLGLESHIDDERLGFNAIVLHQYDPQDLVTMASGGDSTNAEPSSEEMVQKLEAMWDQTPELRETIEEEQWTEFMDTVKSSAQPESESLDQWENTDENVAL